jgi:hypothetical protein
MNKPIYREALKEAWLLTWRNTSLWLIGLISVLFAGSFGLGNFISQLIATMATGGRAAWLLAFHMPSLGTSGISAVFWLVWLCGIMIILAFAVMFVSVTAKTSLLIAVADHYKKQTVPKLSYIWNHGLKYFWNIFTIELARKIALFIVGIIFGIIWILLPFNAGIWNTILDILALIFSVILAWVITAISVFTSGYVVIDSKSLKHALKRAWKLFHEHLFVSFEVSALLTLIDILLIAVFIVIVWVAFVPSLLVWVLAGIFGSQAIALFGVILGFVLFAVIVAIAGGIYNTFYTGVWMYLFMKMHHEGIMSRIFHHTKTFWGK